MSQQLQKKGSRVFLIVAFFCLCTLPWKIVQKCKIVFSISNLIFFLLQKRTQCNVNDSNDSSLICNYILWFDKSLQLYMYMTIKKNFGNFTNLFLTIHKKKIKMRLMLEYFQSNLIYNVSGQTWFCRNCCFSFHFKVEVMHFCWKLARFVMKIYAFHARTVHRSCSMLQTCNHVVVT